MSADGIVNRKKIDTVIFDVGGVLANFRNEEYFSSKGYPEETAARLKAATFDSPDWCELDRGVLTVDEIMARFVRPVPDLENAIRYCFRNFKDMVTKRDTAIPWIDSLKERGYKVYILSNFSEPGIKDCEKALDFRTHVDGCLWSYRYKIIKPDKAIFLTLFYEFGIDPESSVFIDDTRANLEAAEEFGIRTVLYRSQEQAEEELEKLLLR